MKLVSIQKEGPAFPPLKLPASLPGIVSSEKSRMRRPMGPPQFPLLVLPRRLEGIARSDDFGSPFRYRPRSAADAPSWPQGLPVVLHPWLAATETWVVHRVRSAQLSLNRVPPRVLDAAESALRAAAALQRDAAKEAKFLRIRARYERDRAWQVTKELFGGVAWENVAGEIPRRTVNCGWRIRIQGRSIVHGAGNLAQAPLDWAANKWYQAYAAGWETNEAFLAKHEGKVKLFVDAAGRLAGIRASVATVGKSVFVDAGDISKQFYERALALSGHGEGVGWSPQRESAVAAGGAATALLERCEAAVRDVISLVGDGASAVTEPGALDSGHAASVPAAASVASAASAASASAAAAEEAAGWALVAEAHGVKVWRRYVKVINRLACLACLACPHLPLAPSRLGSLELERVKERGGKGRAEVSSLRPHRYLSLWDLGHRSLPPNLRFQRAAAERGELASGGEEEEALLRSTTMPVVKARAAVNASAVSIFELLRDNKRVGEYNDNCKLVIDVQVRLLER